MPISRRTLWLLTVSAVYFLIGYWYLYVQRSDGILILAQAGYCVVCSLPLYCKGIARFLHMRPLLRR